MTPLTPLSLFKCLADDTRLACSLLIHKEGELCVCELVEVLGLSQPKVSRHLALLKTAGLLVSRRQDQWMFYAIHPELPNWASEILQNAVDGADESLIIHTKTLSALSCRPNRC